MFDTLYSAESIWELCVPDLQLDMTTFGRPLTSPATSYTQGGYATDSWDCSVRASAGMAMGLELG